MTSAKISSTVAFLVLISTDVNLDFTARKMFVTTTASDVTVNRTDLVAVYNGQKWKSKWQMNKNANLSNRAALGVRKRFLHSRLSFMAMFCPADKWEAHSKFSKILAAFWPAFFQSSTAEILSQNCFRTFQTTTLSRDTCEATIAVLCVRIFGILSWNHFAVCSWR